MSTQNILNVTGVTTKGVLGNVNVQTSANADVTGVSAVGRIGTVSITANATVTLTGVKAVVKLNTVNVWGLVNTAQSPNWTEVVAA